MISSTRDMDTRILMTLKQEFTLLVQANYNMNRVQDIYLRLSMLTESCVVDVWRQTGGS